MKLTDNPAKIGQEVSNEAPTPTGADPLAIANVGYVNKSKVIVVSTSRDLAATDKGQKLLITAPVTLTWPSGGIANFACNFDIDAGGQLTIAEGTAGEVDAPDGMILQAGEMGHAYSRPDNGKLRLKGNWTA